MSGRRLSPFAGVALFMAAAGLLAACRSVPLPPPARDGFDLLGFFDGAARSEGTVTTLLLRTEPFTARFAGQRRGGTLRLDERFRFADGRGALQRWVLTREGDGTLRGTVETQDGEGRLAAPVPVEGRLTARGAVLAYDGAAPGGGATRLGFRHVMTRLGDGSVANHVTVRLLGLPIATSGVVFRRGEGRLPDAEGAKPAAMD